MSRVIRLLPYVIVALMAILVFNRFTTGSWGIAWSRGTAAPTAPSGEAVRPAVAGPSAPVGFPTARAGTASTNARSPFSAAQSAAPISPLAAGIDRLNNNSDPAVVRSGEAVVLFTTDAAFLRFLGEPNPNLAIAGRIPELRAVRVQMDDTAALGKSLEPFQDEIVDVSPNPKMFLMLPKAADDTAMGVASQLPHLLGIDLAQTAGGEGGSVSRWGRGLLVALLDTGVDPAGLPDPRRVGTLDVGWGMLPASHHGTSLANLIAGPGGTAPSAGILGVRVTDADQVADAFTVAEGVVGAMKAGATIIEISPASPMESELLASAIELADSNSVTVIAATGGSPRSWPASNRHVIAVNSVVAPRVPVTFDGTPLPQLTQGNPAVSLGVPLPGGGSELVSVDAPASATIVAGAMAAVFSAYPRLSAAQAWTTLQRYAVSPEAVSANVEGLYSVGYQVLNLSWIAMPPDERPQRPGPPARGRNQGIAQADLPSQNAGGLSASTSPLYLVGGTSRVANPTRAGTPGTGRGPSTSRGSTTGRGNTPARGSNTERSNSGSTP